MKVGTNSFRNNLNGSENVVSVSCEKIQRNIWRWDELFPELKAFLIWYHVNSPLEVPSTLAHSTQMKRRAFRSYGRVEVIDNTLEVSVLFQSLTGGQLSFR